MIGQTALTLHAHFGMIHNMFDAGVGLKKNDSGVLDMHVLHQTVHAYL